MLNFFCRFSRYERLLRRAKTEDLNEVSGIGCLYQSGVDRLGRPVIVFVGKWFPFNQINLDKVSFSFIIIKFYYDRYSTSYFNYAKSFVVPVHVNRPCLRFKSIFYSFLGSFTSHQFVRSYS